MPFRDYSEQATFERCYHRCFQLTIRTFRGFIIRAMYFEFLNVPEIQESWNGQHPLHLSLHKMNFELGFTPFGHLVSSCVGAFGGKKQVDRGGGSMQ